MVVEFRSFFLTIAGLESTSDDQGDAGVQSHPPNVPRNGCWTHLRT